METEYSNYFLSTINESEVDDAEEMSQLFQTNVVLLIDYDVVAIM